MKLWVFSKLIFHVKFQIMFFLVKGIWTKSLLKRKLQIVRKFKNFWKHCQIAAVIVRLVLRFKAPLMFKGMQQAFTRSGVQRVYSCVCPKLDLNNSFYAALKFFQVQVVTYFFLKRSCKLSMLQEVNSFAKKHVFENRSEFDQK